MEDFEYSVDISDRDWECFFTECEECSLLPPSLAGVDDSGMSDIDDTGSILSKRVQKVDLTDGFSEADRPIDGPPDCEGSPVEHYLSNHTIGGMESVLSGSEEDIHLQSVNIFFERLKRVTEAESLIDPNQERDGKKQEAIQEEEQRSDGQQASSRFLPKHLLQLNSLPASGETAVGKETTNLVNTIDRINTMKEDVPGPKISPKPAASTVALTTYTSAYPKKGSFIREEACTEKRITESTLLNQSQDTLEVVVCSEASTHTDKMIKAKMCSLPEDLKQDDLLMSQLILSKECRTDPLNNQEIVTPVKRNENPDVLQSDATTASQELSPSASFKRRRRRKRRLNVEPADSGHRYEMQDLVKPSDSEEEQYAWRERLNFCLSENTNLPYSSQPRQNGTPSFTTLSATSNLPVKISAKENKVNDFPSCDVQYQHSQESVVRKGKFKATSPDENNVPNNRSIDPFIQTDDSVLSPSNNSGNVATNVKPCSKLHAEDSTVVPVSKTYSVYGTSTMAIVTENCERQDILAGSLRQSNEINHSIFNGNKQYLGSCTAEDNSISILPSAESKNPAVEVRQHDKLSVAKSVLAVRARNFGRDYYTLCQREAEPQHQLEIDCEDRDRFRSTLENTDFPLSASSSDARTTKCKKLETSGCPFLEISSQVGCAKSSLDTSNELPYNHDQVERSSSSDMNITAQQTEYPLLLHTISKCDGLSESDRTELGASQSAEKNSTKPSMSKDSLTSPLDTTPVSSCCTFDTESVMSLLNENIADISGASCLSVNKNDPGDQAVKTSLILSKHEEGDGTSESRDQCVSHVSIVSKCDLMDTAEGILTVSTANCELEKASKQSVFAMSSFWSEMEKLTINDILGLRMIRNGVPRSPLSPLKESEETDMSAITDSGIFSQPEEFQAKQTNKDTSSDPNSEESSSVTVDDSSSSTDVMWESLGADVYPENMMLTSAGDISQPVFPAGSQTCLRKMAKNVSINNLHALNSESFYRKRKGPALLSAEKGELEKEECHSDGHIPKQYSNFDSLSSFPTDSYNISLTNIFQYLFGGKQSIPSQSATDNIPTSYSEGNSVPETYDHFFSEFDTGSFFYPLITKEKLVPIFPYSRSATRDLKFPEAYEHFFASSSSDDSSGESDEEDGCSPVRVVTRFSRKTSASQISTDIYEHFFTDGDLRQNFFWNTTLSFRNMSLTKSTIHKESLSNPQSCVPVRQSSRSIGRIVHPVNALGNEDIMFPDPLLHHLDNRFYTQLIHQPFSFDDLQTAVSNPRLDASLLPLRQSDMCLVCIAFASWVLKTANPQVGDTWKAVLLANVSALSAIRYLRKYVKMEAAASERKLKYTAPSDS